jgi:hypothetical protein
MDEQIKAKEGREEERERHSQTTSRAPAGRVAVQGRNGGTLMAFAPGVSGNPGGRPKSFLTVAENLKRVVPTMDASEILAIATGTQKCQDANLKIACRLVATAMGDVEASRSIDEIKAAAEVMDRTDGKAAQTIMVGPRVENIDGQDLLTHLRAQVAGQLP